MNNASHAIIGKARSLAQALGAAVFVLMVPVLASASPAAHEAAGAEHGDGHGGLELFTPIFGSDGKTGIVWLLVNFAVLMWILNKVLFSKLKVKTAKKSDDIKAELARATQAHDEASSIIAEYRGRMGRLDQEIDELKAGAKKRAAADKAEIIAEAKKEAERIKQAALATAEREGAARRREIENEIIDRAMEQAEALIRKRIKPADQTRFASTYVKQVDSVNFADSSRRGTTGAT